MTATASGGIPNPFSSSPVGPPEIYAKRDDVEAEIIPFLSALDSRVYSRGIHLEGTRGIGKSVEMRRIGEQLLALGALPVRVRLTGHQSSHIEITRALAQLTGERIGGDTARLSASANFGIGQVGYEREILRSPLELSNLIDGIYSLGIETTPAIVFLIDESDLLEHDALEHGLVSVLEEAATDNLPISVVTAGLGPVPGLSGFGVRSFAPDLIQTITMARLTEGAGADLLRDTAKLGNQDWSDHEVQTLSKVSNGIPRLLNYLGRDVFSRKSAGLDHPVETAIRWLRRSMDTLVFTQLTSSERRLYSKLVTIRPENMFLTDLEDVLILNQTEWNVETVSALLRKLQYVGALEISGGQTVTFIQP